MPRLPRIQPVGLPLHITQRGNNRSACFFEEADYLAYLHWLKEGCETAAVAIQGYALMTNHVHLLVIPRAQDAVPRMMQTLGRHYVHYINKRYGRSGTLWERRYRASLIESEDYMLEVYRYIDLNPVRAGMVLSPENHRWSSARQHLGLEPTWLEDHESFVRLGEDAERRGRAYRAVLDEGVSEERLDAIRVALNTGQALGSQHFREEIEAVHQGRVSHRPAGRKPKQDGLRPEQQMGLEL